MQRKFRLTRSTDFKRVRRTGKSYAHPLVVLVVHASEAPRVRVGVTAGRSVGGAVLRNRSKRLLREAMRPMLPNLLPGWDLILIARPALPSASLPEIHQALANLLHRAQILPAPHEC
ncbi:MAG: ribonuclease P protein component [Anaerolineales bacterium]